MTGRFEFVHSIRVPGMLHGRVLRPPAMGATVAHVDEQSVRHLPGLTKVVVRKDFVGVVAETQYQAVSAARQLVVRWKAGPELPPQKSFFDQLQKNPSHDCPKRRLAGCGQTARCCEQCRPREIHLPIPDARISRGVVCRG